MFIILKNDYFQLWVFYESDLGISTAGKCIGSICQILTHLNLKKTTIQSAYLISCKGFKGISVNRTLTSLHEGSIIITLTIPLTVHPQF